MALRVAANRELLAGELLLRELHLLLDTLRLLDRLLKEELDVARAGLVRRHATVRTVRAAAARRRTVHGNVRDEELVGVEVLRFCVRLRILQQADQHLDALLRPATLRVLELIRLRGATNATTVPAERNHALLLEDSVEVGEGLAEFHALDGLRAVVHVLVVRGQVNTRSLARARCVLGLRAVLNLSHLARTTTENV